MAADTEVGTIPPAATAPATPLQETISEDQVPTELDALRDRHSTFADLELSTAVEVRYEDKDFSLELSVSEPVYFLTVFEPTGNYKSSDTRAEVIELAEAAGWEISDFDLYQSIGTHPDFPQDKLVIAGLGNLPDPPQLTVSVSHRLKCSDDGRHGCFVPSPTSDPDQ